METELKVKGETIHEGKSLTCEKGIIYNTLTRYEEIYNFIVTNAGELEIKPSQFKLLADLMIKFRDQ